MTRLLRTRARGLLVLAACLVVPAVPAAGGIMTPLQTTVVPAKLVGRWTRTITKADIKRSYGYGNTPGTVCTLTIEKGGATHLTVAHIGGWDGRTVSVGADRIHFTYGDPTGNVYRWRVSGRLLTLTKLQDGTPDRATAMWGVWKRK